MDGAELSGTGKVGMGAACAVCCVVPVAVLTGALSVTALVTGGVAAAAAVAVVGALWSFHRRALVHLRTVERRAISGLGVALAIVGLAVLESSREVGRSLVATGVAVLGRAAVFALDAAM